MLRSGHFKDEPEGGTAEGFEARLRESWEAQAKAPQGDTFRSELGDASYWENLYAGRSQAAASEVEVYDWLLAWRDIQFLVEPLMGHDHTCTVLHLGVGNSLLPEEMYDCGYKHQTSVDVSASVIEQMRERNLSRPGMAWLAGDCTDLTEQLPEIAFRLTIDKSCVDALFCHDAHVLMVTKYLKEASRLTQQGGVFLCMSVHQPKDMQKWLNRKAYGWRVRSVSLPASTTAYICSKVVPTAECLEKHWPSLLQQAEMHPDSELSEEEGDEEEEEEEQEVEVVEQLEEKEV
mmetsp:Transcript_53665/g.120504  ORF Transcript_53665/g.120504 Transcript_53665/m.120504 type:complete len:290 (+) Transcript_53665:45-914(+)